MCHAIERPLRGIATGAPPRFLLGQTIGALQDAVLLVDIERLIPEAGEGLLAVAGIGEIPRVAAPRLDGDEIAEMIADMLLHGIVGAQMLGDLGIDLVPQAADLTLQIAAQRAEIFIEFPRTTGEDMGSAHALTMRQMIERHGAAAAVNTAPARTLDDHARHVSTHGSTPVAKGDRVSGRLRAARSPQRRHFPEKTIGAVISGGADVDQARPDR